MKNILLTASILIIMTGSLILSGCKNELTFHASGNKGVVAAGAPESALAGKYILSRGGNAVDAAVATIFNLAVSDYGYFCIGGEVPLIFYSADDKKVTVFNGMGSAPLDTSAINWYYNNGIPKTGIRSATVPSAVSTCLAVLEMKGTMSFARVIAPTLKLLDKGGQDWYPQLAVTLRKLVETERSTSGSREQKIRAARDRFYKGDIADELEKYYISSGAFFRKADLVAHRTMVEEPVHIRYRGYDVYKCNTWTQGPVMLQGLRLLEKFDLRSMGFLSADYVHVVTEAMKLAYADRDKYYGDPAFVSVPLNALLSDQYTDLRWSLIDMKQASKEIRPGDPLNMSALAGPGQYLPGEKGTTTCVVVDKWGNMVSATPSANPEYGVCESLGIAHNTRLSSLNIQKGHPNALAAGKRPRITLTPTIVLKDGRPFLGISVQGGDLQDQVALQLMLDVVEFGIMPVEAIASPRFKISHLEDSFNPSADPLKRIGKTGTVDTDTLSTATIHNLEQRGHVVNRISPPIANPVMVFVDESTGMAYAAGEPKPELEGKGKGKYCAAVD